MSNNNSGHFYSAISHWQREHAALYKINKKVYIETSKTIYSHNIHMCPTQSIDLHSRPLSSVPATQTKVGRKRTRLWDKQLVFRSETTVLSQGLNEPLRKPVHAHNKSIKKSIQTCSVLQGCDRKVVPSLRQTKLQQSEIQLVSWLVS